MRNGLKNTELNRFPFFLLFLSMGAALMGGPFMLLILFLVTFLCVFKMVDFRVLILVFVGMGIIFLWSICYTPLPHVQELLGRVVRSRENYFILNDVKYPDRDTWREYPFPVKVVGKHGANFGEYVHVIVRRVEDSGFISVVSANRVSSVRVYLNFIDIVYAWFYRVFERILGYLRTIFQNDSPVIEGLLLGRYHEELRDYRDVGVGHLFAVSGMHVYFMAAIVIVFVRHIFIKRALRLIIPPLVIWLYVGVINFPPSAVRAAAMFSVYNFFRLMDRYIHPLNVLGLVGAVNLLLWPHQIHEPSFQLSYMATFGILTAGRNLAGRYGRGFLGNLWDTVVYTLSAQVMVLPVSVMTFRILHPYGWLATILLAHLLPFLLVGGIAVLMASYFELAPLVDLLKNGCSVFIKLSNMLVSAVSKLPFSSVRISEPWMFYLFSSLSIFSVILFISFSWQEGQRP